MKSISNQILTRIAALALVAGLSFSPILRGGGTIEIDEFKKISIGVGLRTSFNFVEDANAVPGSATKREDGKDLTLDSMRLYVSGQVHEYVKFTFNTERSGSNTTTDGADIEVIDGIVQLEYNDYFNIWMGRFLPPSDRSNFSGPYYLNSWHFPGGGPVAGGPQAFPNITNGRDEGIAYWGQANGGQVKWQVGLFEGNQNAILNSDDNFLVAGRLTLNLWDPEPGYYNASTYYGGKDTLAIGLVGMSQSESGGTTTGGGPNPIDTQSGDAADFTGFSVDFLAEKVLGNDSVVTFEAAYYDYDTDGEAVNTFPFAQGDGFFVLASYLFPETGWEINGRFQPMIRYLSFDRDGIASLATAPNGPSNAGLAVVGQDADTLEIGLNYIIDGFNLRLFSVYGMNEIDRDVGIDPDDTDYFTFGVQLQL